MSTALRLRTVPDFAAYGAALSQALRASVNSTNSSSPSIVPIASTSSSTSSSSSSCSNRQLLVSLDIHGVLCERIRGRDPAEIQAKKAALSYCRPWRVLRQRHIFLRPHIRPFLRMLFARHDVALWTSATKPTVTSFLNALDEDFDEIAPIREKFKFLRIRDDCDKDTQLGGFATVKKVERIWNENNEEQRDVQYGPSNTILLDDSASKIRHSLGNAVVVPEYTALRLQASYTTDETLLWIALYIEFLKHAAENRAAENVGKNNDTDREQEEFSICDVELSYEEFRIQGEAIARDASVDELDPKWPIAAYFIEALKDDEENAVPRDLQLRSNLDPPSWRRRRGSFNRHRERPGHRGTTKESTQHLNGLAHAVIDR